MRKTYNDPKSGICFLFDKCIEVSNSRFFNWVDGDRRLQMQVRFEISDNFLQPSLIWNNYLGIFYRSLIRREKLGRVYA